MKTRIILIDLENVQPNDLSRLAGLPVVIRVLLGPSQAKISLSLVAALQPFGDAVQYIQLQNSGKNALDFHLAFYLGRLSCEYPDALFYIISKDTGFDPLVKHLGSLRIACRRLEGIERVPANITAKPSEPAPQDNIARAQAYLIKCGKAKPKKVSTLRSALKVQLGGSLAEAEIDAVVDRLRAARVFEEGATGSLIYPAR